MSLEKARQSKTFCVMPWIHQYVGTAGDVKPCCIYKHKQEIGNLKESTLSEIWNNSKTREMRLKFLNGETDIGCYHCDSRVNIGADDRSMFNDNFFKNNKKIQDVVDNTRVDGSLNEHRLFYIDVRFNNLCNFSCRTCSPDFSTSWILDAQRLYQPNSNKTVNVGYQFAGKTEEQALEEIIPHLSSVIEVYFAGGEPLIQQEHYAVLLHLLKLNQTNCLIRYNTNLSKLTLGKHDVVKYWKTFANTIRVDASIDASYSKAEYWRRGTVWKNIIDNVTRIQTEAPNVTLGINFTLGWPNSMNLVELHKEWTEKKYININNISIFLLQGPDYYSLKYVPDFKKNKIVDLLNQHITWLKEKEAEEYTIQKFVNAINYIKEDVDISNVHKCLREFNHYTNKLDQIRGENFWQVFPEHQDLREYINQNLL